MIEFADLLNDHRRALDALEAQILQLERMASMLIEALRAEHKVLICGNGGSAADAQHFAAELSGRFEIARRALPALALTTDTSALTAIANDYGYSEVFARQVAALGQANDVLLLISTSGQSPNVLRAAEVGRQRGLTCLALCGSPGALYPQAASALKFESFATARVQEMHIIALHFLCTRIDAALSIEEPKP